MNRGRGNGMAPWGVRGNMLKIWKLIYDTPAQLNLAGSFKLLFSFLYFGWGKRQLAKINDRCSAKNKNIGHKLKMMSRFQGKMKGKPVVREAAVF